LLVRELECRSHAELVSASEETLKRIHGDSSIPVAASHPERRRRTRTMKYIVYIFLLISFSSYAQYSFKVKREDNRFLFFQMGAKNDTIIKNKSDLFLIKIPDSLKNNLHLFIKNGQFIKTDNDSVYRLIPILGMKYSHSKQDTIFHTLLEGTCTPSKTITIEFINNLNQRRVLQNKFIVK
jgi:hypothetical protein